MSLPAGLLLVASSAALTAPAPRIELEDTADQSQRRLPFPERQPTIPDVHVELLRRLREALQQTEPRPDPSLPGDSEQAETPPSPREPASPPPIPPDDLRQLGESLGDLIKKIPPGIIPKELPILPAPQLQQSLQHPETQKSLQKLLEQFRKDGILPPNSPDGTPAPTPPEPSPDVAPASPAPPSPSPDPSPAAPAPADPLTAPPPSDPKTPALPRESLRQLENFLNELKQNAPAPKPQNEQQPAPPQTRSAAPNPNTVPQTVPRNPLRRRDRSTSQPAPETTPKTSPDDPATSNSAQNSPPASPGTPTPTPQSPNTTGSRSFLESLGQLFQQSPAPSSDKTQSPPADNPSSIVPEAESPTPDSPAGDAFPDGEDKRSESFSIPDFLRQQFQDPTLRPPERSESESRPDADAPVASPSAPPTPPQPSRNRPPADLPPNQSFRDSLRQMLNEARQEAREQTQAGQIQPPAVPQPPIADPSRTSPPPSSSPRIGQDVQDRAKSLLKMLDDLSKDADRRGSDRPESLRSGGSMQDPEQSRERVDSSTLDWLLRNQLPEDQGSGKDASELEGRLGANPDAGASSGSRPTSALPMTALSLAALLAGGLAAIWLLLQFNSRRRLEAAGIAGAGPSLTPEQICGRGDVVVAFHQLARRAGRSFKPWWHHQQIESLLMQAFPGRQSSITRLAGLYEQSRYSPESISLSQEDLQSAREAFRECQTGPRKG